MNIPYIFKLLTVSLFVVVSFAQNTFGQVTLYAEKVEAERGQEVEIPIKVLGFNNIVSMQFTLSWDATILRYKEVRSLTDSLPQFSTEGVSAVGADNGELIVIWFDNSVSGVNLSDSTSLLTLVFEVVGEEGDKSAIAFTEIVEVLEIVGSTPIELNVELENGEVIIPQEMLSTSTTFLQAQNGMRLFQNQPNPFQESTYIEINLSTSEWVTFMVTDALGTLVHEQRFQSRIGTNTVVVNRDELPISGIYNYTIQSENHQLSKQMILLP